MKKIILLLICLINILITAQNKNPIGTFENSTFEITFRNDKTFEYRSKYLSDPIGNHTQTTYIENGKWSIDSDTIRLNAQLDSKSFGSHELLESVKGNPNKIYFKFNLIKQYFDEKDNIISRDTLQIERLDLAINNNDKSNRSRITQSHTTRCAFAGYIPNELITNERSFEFERNTPTIQKLYIGSYELGETREFIIKNPASNSFILNIYQNIYKTGMIRNIKYLMYNKNTILIKQKPNGKFRRDGMYYEFYQIKRK